MEDRELVFAPRLNVFTGDNSLGKSFLLDLLWFGLTRTWPADLNRRLCQGLPARPRAIDASASLRYDYRPAGYDFATSSEFAYDRVSGKWKAPRGKPHNAGLVVYAMADGGFAVWDPIRNAGGETEEIEGYRAYVLSSAELWPPPPLRDGSTETLVKSSFCNGVVKDWAKWQGGLKDQKTFELLKQAMLGLTPPGDIVGFPDLQDAETEGGDDQPVLRLKYGDVRLVHASSSIRRMASLAYVLVWAITQHVKAAKNRGLPVTRQIVVLADEIETHLHPRWQRSVMDGLMRTVDSLCHAGGIDDFETQLFVSTHSPLVMAALEDVFCGRDKWFDFDLQGDSRSVEICERKFRARGNAENWLRSPAFDLDDTHAPQVAALLREAQQILDACDCGESLSSERRSRLDALLEKLASRNLNDIDDIVYRLDRLARHSREARP